MYPPRSRLLAFYWKRYALSEIYRQMAWNRFRTALNYQQNVWQGRRTPLLQKGCRWNCLRTTLIYQHKCWKWFRTNLSYQQNVWQGSVPPPPQKDAKGLSDFYWNQTPWRGYFQHFTGHLQMWCLITSKSAGTGLEPPRITYTSHPPPKGLSDFYLKSTPLERQFPALCWTSANVMPFQ